MALIGDGWLPPVYAIKNANVILDRNVINEILERFDDGKIKLRKENDSISCIAGDRTYSFNLTYFALESNKGSLPSDEIIESQIVWARNVISKKIPQAIFSYSKEQEVSVTRQLRDYYIETAKSRQNFLRKTIKNLSRNTPVEKRKEAWDAICQDALEQNLKKQIVVYYVL